MLVTPRVHLIKHQFFIFFHCDCGIFLLLLFVIHFCCFYFNQFALFQIVGEKFDNNQENSNSKYYETIYALLDSMSPGYTKSFGEALVRKLSSLQSPTSEDLEIPDECADEAACS